jgi:hypothetical protein
MSWPLRMPANSQRLPRRGLFLCTPGKLMLPIVLSARICVRVSAEMYDT